MRYSKMSARYLLWFAQEHVDFRHAEIQSILSMFKIPIIFIEKSAEKPYWIVELSDEDSLRKLASRSVSIKNCIQLWGRAKTAEELHNNLRRVLKNDRPEWVTDNSEAICPSVLIKNCCDGKRSFKIEVETFCKHFTMPEKVAKIEKFEYLPLHGPVRLNNPDIKLMYLEFYGMDPNNIPDEPYDLFFGKWIVDGQRDIIHTHSLKTRSFIGNTSMDAQLSLLMANQGQVKPGDFVLDPFVGSGSILIAAAHFGGYVWGSDIDYMMLHSRTRPTRFGQKSRAKDESILSNMKQYGIKSKYLDVIVSDFSLPLWREDLQFDSIITDPPYGVREPTEKIGIERDNYSLSDTHLENHIPAKVDYGLPHIYCDLLNFSARYLRLGGRLVCWYPLVREDYTEDHLPSHPCLSLISNSEQILSKLTSRRLLTYEKVHETVPHMPVDPNSGTHNFREKYFAFGEISRKERKERKAEELAANAVYIARSKNSEKS